MARHCWILKGPPGRAVLTCDSCEARAVGVRDSRNLPDEGCPGSLFEQTQRGPNRIIPTAAYIEQAHAAGFTTKQIADAWCLTPSDIDGKQS